jgi:CheY-like chemotaxis protein
MEETSHGGRSRSTADPGDFAVLGAAHDANQLLGVILSRAQLLRQTESSSERLHHLDAIAAAARDAAAILIGLLDGQPPTDSVVASGVASVAAVAAVVESCWEAGLVAVSATGQDVAGYFLAADIAAELTAAAPAYQVRQVIANLLTNALQAMPEGGTVRCRGRRDGDRIHLAIQDDGPGLTDQDCQRIFLPGYTRGKPGGHGIGLFHSRGLIEAAGGRLIARATPGEGATFLIELPAAAGERCASAAAPASADTAAAGGSLAILAVDDEAPVRDLLADILATDGHRVTLAADGEEALKLFAPGRFDLVLVDYALAGLTGLDVARAVKQADREITVALVTGWGNERARAAADPGLVDWWETKPLDLPKIRRLLARVSRRGAGPDAEPPVAS